MDLMGRGRGSPAGGAHLREGLTCGRGSPGGGRGAGAEPRVVEASPYEPYEPYETHTGLVNLNRFVEPI